MSKLKQSPIKTDFGILSYNFRPNNSWSYTIKSYGDYEFDLFCEKPRKSEWKLKLNDNILKTFTLGYDKNDCENGKCKLCKYIKNNTELYEKRDENETYKCATVSEFDIDGLKAIVELRINSEYIFNVGFIDPKLNIVYYYEEYHKCFDYIEKAEVIDSKLFVTYSDILASKPGERVYFGLKSHFDNLYKLIKKHDLSAIIN